jgi:hypothetical protein
MGSRGRVRITNPITRQRRRFANGRRTTLSAEQTETLLNSIQKRMAGTPVFPSSNQIGGKVAGERK